MSMNFNFVNILYDPTSIFKTFEESLAFEENDLNPIVLDSNPKPKEKNENKTPIKTPKKQDASGKSKLKGSKAKASKSK